MSRFVRPISLLTFIFLFYTEAFSKSKSKVYPLEEKMYPVLTGVPDASALREEGLRLFSDKDLNKYRLNKRGIAEASLRTVIPVGLGIGLVFVSGPLACIPIAVGIGNGIKALVDCIKRKKVKRLILGSLLYLRGESVPLSEKEKKSLHAFDKFYQDTYPRIRAGLDTDASLSTLKVYLASRLLILNRYGFLISNRFNHDPDCRELLEKQVQADAGGKYSKSFFKKNILPLIIATEKILSECPPEKLEILAFGKPLTSAPGLFGSDY